MPGKKVNIWKLLDGDHPAMLLYVLQSVGSSPGRQGFCMAVNDKGDMEGSIGGGIMEHKFVELAKEMLKEGNHCALVKKQVHDKSASADRSGMICSGEQTIFLYRIQHADLSPVRQIISAIENHTGGTLLLSMQGIRFDSNALLENHHYQTNPDGNWVYSENIGYRHFVYIIGGGHCSLALSRMMAQLDFHVSVYDDRANLKTFEQNDSANHKAVIPDYTHLGSLIPEGMNHYVVIATFGYRTDDLAIRSLLGKRFRYIGILGSRKKIEKMMDDYRKEAVPEEWLDRLTAPVGLDINSQTPEEIAVSIAAQIISIKNSVPGQAIDKC